MQPMRTGSTGRSARPGSCPPLGGDSIPAMHHPSARLAVERILAGSGFGDRALALRLAAGAADCPGGDEALRERLLARAIQLPGDRAPVMPTVDAPLPDDAAALATQLAPAIIRNPADVGAQLAQLEALAALWPHVAAAERAPLRARLLASATQRGAPSASMASSEQLRAWQRDLPTCCADEAPSVEALRALLTESSPGRAYRVLAVHLGCDLDLAALTRVLGSLAAQVLLGRRDPHGLLTHDLLGSAAAGRLVALTPPELLASLTCQLAHHLWWCRNEAGLATVRVTVGADPLPLPVALRAGDITAAQRAARATSAAPAAFWSAVWDLVDEAAAWDDASWLRALSAATAVAWRSGEAVPPDDAAALASVLADLAWQGGRRPVAVA